MNRVRALESFAALAQETRLRVIRLLVKAGHAGLPAGGVAAAVGASASNVSFHLKELERAGLIAQRREARSIIYTAEYDALRGLIGFLMKDCCAGRREILSPIYAKRYRAPARKKARPARRTRR